jgi:transposase
MNNTPTSQRSRKAAQGREGEVSTNPSSKRCKLILLGVDTHGKQYTFARKIENLGIQPAQKLSPAKFLGFLGKQVALARRVVIVYEAGPFGYTLYRQASKLGVECLVCAPERLDRGRRRVNDKIDAGELTSRLDRHLAGNDKALRLVRPPTLQQELLRAQVRERSMYVKERNRWKGRGRSALQLLGVLSPGRWWEEQRLAEVLEELGKRHGQAVAEELGARLGRYREQMLALDKLARQLTAEICTQTPAKPEGQKCEGEGAGGEVRPARVPRRPRIKGIGVLTEQLLDREIISWDRFSNRRQVASYTGLCPGEDSSGESEVKLPIDKHGNPRIRAALVEIAWLLPKFQPDYIRLQRWKWVFEKDTKASRALRKKAVTALARMLAVDLWRIRTGRCTPEALGLQRAA